MKKFISLVIALFFCHFAEASKNYHSEKQGFTVELPESWKTDFDESFLTLFSEESKQTGFGIIKQPLELQAVSEVGTEALLNKFLEMLNLSVRDYHNFELKAKNIVIIDGEKGIKQSASYQKEKDDQEQFIVTYIFLKEADLFILTGEVPEEKSSKMQKTFDSIAFSFQR